MNTLIIIVTLIAIAGLSYMVYDAITHDTKAKTH